MGKLHLGLLVACLIAVGMGLFLYKTLALHFPLEPHAYASVWTIEAAVAVQADDEPVKVSLHIPQNTARFH
ncbi:MAG: UUP1 family membrane protein, partial [Bdellovibrionales bacterium]|nr:UUP1 family membrane protein [Bdellovibrionales bacterium]